MFDDNEAVRLRAEKELQSVTETLRGATRILRRDWENMAPRERSAQSRIVKELERQKRALEEEIEMNSGT